MKNGQISLMISKISRHIFAVIYRRSIIHRRSKMQLARSIFLTIFSSIAALLVQYRSNQNDRFNVKPISFAKSANGHQIFGVIGAPSIKDNLFVQNLVNDTQQLIFNESGYKIEPVYFNSPDEFDKWVYSTSNSSYKNKIAVGKYILFAYEISISGDDYHITFYHNHTATSRHNALLNIERLIYKRQAENSHAKIEITPVLLMRHLSTTITSESVPAFVTFGIINICILFISQAIEDIGSERRPYMLLCGLSRIEYWIGCFISDFITWVFVTTGFWGLYVFAETPMFYENKLLSWCVLQMCGPGILFVVYCISFIFGNIDTGANYAYFVLMLPFIVFSMSSDLTPNHMFNALLEYLQYAYPVSDLYMLLSYVAIGQMKTKYMMTAPLSAGIFLFFLIMIEFSIIYSEKSATKINFALFIDEFLKRREKHVSVGAKEHEVAVKSNQSFILRCVDVCRIFFTTRRHCLPAVNHVNIGVTKGECYGLLGANGAGKTTLLKMIYGRIPQSHGSILMEGKPVKKGMIALCPQFDDHLSAELTGYENLRFFSLLYGIGYFEFEKLLRNIVRELDLEDHINKQIQHMSGGNQRKISIAVALLSSSPLILLDEPTSSLDPSARQRVHDLIVKSKGNKTFVLCTHLLNEAEKLCDSISIMIKGCIYTYGSPQFLAAHFGREWKLDVLLDSTNSSQPVKDYIKREIPFSKFSFERHKTLVFTIPSQEISLTSVFEIMQRAIDNKVGVAYFSCSSSTLEKVFMELVKLAENDSNVIETTTTNK